MERAELAARIDQTLLKPTVSMREAHEWMQRNAGLGFASLCVSPFLVPLAAEVLAGTPTAVCSVVGFPLGYSLTETKTEEARQLVELGCMEIDMVMNVGAFLGGEVAVVHEDVAQVVEAVRRASHGRGLVKVILETGYLDEAQIAEASRLSVEAGAHFVKTSTGFGPRGASVEDVRIMRQAVGDRAQVKAAGGIRDLDMALAMIEAGADRIGTSSGAEILAALEASAGS
ncbi:MAG: deoxyribose-phosphate aldolase [Coriobacteriia bacterium]|nr:deoxyribose-phosphate aldolase [Coriobacteriia bacterium]